MHLLGGPVALVVDRLWCGGFQHAGSDGFVHVALQKRVVVSGDAWPKLTLNTPAFHDSHEAAAPTAAERGRPRHLCRFMCVEPRRWVSG